MKDVLVIGASGGIGQAMCQALQALGANVVALSRRVDGLDVTDPASVERHIGALAGPFDLVFVSVGVLAPQGRAPEKSLSAINAADMAEVMAVNAIGPALILRQVPRLLVKDRPARVAVLSARVGSIGDNRIGGWHSYRASKAALNQIVRGAAIELGRTHKQASCVALHPGTVETAFTAKYAGRHKTMPADEAAQNLLTVLGRLGPEHSGEFFDWAGEGVPW